jgi:hypothetical protein
MIPVELAGAIKEIQIAVERLGEISKPYGKKFTLDGRLVGDLGEVIAANFFDIELTKKQQAGFDAKILSGPNKNGEVEIKCRRKSKPIDFARIPTFLIVLNIEADDETVELVYAGEGSVVARILSKRATPSKKARVSLEQLRSQFKFEDYRKQPTIPLKPQSQNKIAPSQPTSKSC